MYLELHLCTDELSSMKVEPADWTPFTLHPYILKVSDNTQQALDSPNSHLSSPVTFVTVLETVL